MSGLNPLSLATSYARIKYRRKFPRNPKTTDILWIIIIVIALYIILIRGCQPI